MRFRSGAVRRRSRAPSAIPDSSLADIAFLLLIFFMVSTVFRKEEPRDIAEPIAAAAEPVEATRADVLHLYVERDGSVFINDQRLTPAEVGRVVAPLRVERGERLVVAVRADRAVPYAVIHTVTEQLRAAGALRVQFAARPAPRQTAPPAAGSTGGAGRP